MANQDEQVLQLSLVADYLSQNGFQACLSELSSQVTAVHGESNYQLLNLLMQTPNGIKVLSKESVLTSLRLSKLAKKREPPVAR